MATLATLTVSLLLDAAKFQKELDKQAGTLGNFKKRLSAIGSGLTTVGKGMTAGLTLPLIGAGLAAVDAASDLEESMNKVQVVFGDAADSVVAFSQTAATSLGQSQQQALEAVGTFGNLFTSMGLGQDVAADMSTGLVTLASDLASFNNLDPTEVLDKLRSGLVGEVEPLRTLGVNLNQAMVQQRALEMGLADTADALTPAMLTQARYALILEQTANAQGDFARTSDGLANSQRIVKAQLRDLAASLGQELLPYAQQAVTWFRSLLDRFTALDPSTRRMVVVIAAIAAAAGPVLLVLGMLVSAIGALISPIGLVIAIVGLLAAAWAGNWGGIRDILMDVWENNLKPAFETLVAWLQENIPVALQFLSNFWQTVLLPAIQKVWSFISTVLIPIFLGIADVSTAVVGTAIRALAGLWQKVLWPALKKIWKFIQEKILPVLQRIADKVMEVVGPALQWLKDNVIVPLIGPFNNIKELIGNVVENMHKLAEKIRNLELPDWLTPGSPTPFEIGLRGIVRAMGDLNRIELPSLAGNMGRLDVAFAGAGGPASVREGDVNINVYGVPMRDEQDLRNAIRYSGLLLRTS